MKSTYFKKNTKLFISNSQQGLTFIELIVVMSIFSIIASVVLFNFSSFSTNITSQNLAQEIALQIKQAQTDSISGTRSMVFERNVDNREGAPTYGVRFNINQANADELDAHSMIYFADRNGNGVYDTTGSGCDYSVTGTECLAVIRMNTSDTIVGMCADADCDSGAHENTTATILFRRPFPDAKLFVEDDGIPRSRVGITIRSPKGVERLITTTVLGQISVSNAVLPPQ